MPWDVDFEKITEILQFEKDRDTQRDERSATCVNQKWSL